MTDDDRKRPDSTESAHANLSQAVCEDGILLTQYVNRQTCISVNVKFFFFSMKHMKESKGEYFHSLNTLKLNFYNFKTLFFLHNYELNI